jgi:hypothetical protein
MSQQPRNDLLAALGETMEITTSPQEQKAQEEIISSQQSFNRDEVIALAKSNLDFFAGLVLPGVMTFCFPPLFHAIWELLISKANLTRDFSKLALGIPRGFAKTTFMKLFMVWCILFTDRKFFLVVGATAKHAENILADVMSMLDSPNVKTTFGDWRIGVIKNTQEEKMFGFRGRTILLVAIGAGSSPRGINKDNSRPDFLLMDDLQTRENAKSPVLSDELLEWMLGTLMKTKDNHRCLYIFIGNMYPYPGSILRKLRLDPNWTSLIVGALLADGESIWPELRSKEDLLDEFASDLALGKPEIFLSEVLNDENAANRSTIDITKIPHEPIGLAEALPQGKFIVIDPAGRKKGSDKHAIGHFSVYDGRPLLDDLENAIMTPGQCIRNALRMAFKHNTFLIAVESVAYQETLLYWFGVIAEQLGVSGIDFVEIYPGSDSKNGRIKGMLAQLLDVNEAKKAEILVADKLRSLVLTQIVQWNPLKTDNVDDILDLLVYAPRVILTYGHLAAIRDIVVDGDFEAAKVLTLAENCNF